MNSQKITGLAVPTDGSDAATKYYADNTLIINTANINSIGVATSSVSLNGYKITNLADAASATDTLNL